MRYPKSIAWFQHCAIPGLIWKCHRLHEQLTQDCVGINRGDAQALGMELLAAKNTLELALHRLSQLDATNNPMVKL